jgi:RND superfamily putative drug exporter
MGVVAVVSMLVGVLFTPAACAILGRRLFWPSRRQDREAPARGDRPAPLRRRVAAAVSRRRTAIVVSLALGALLMAAASGVLVTRISITPIEALPPGAEAAAGAGAAERGFADGIVAPTEVSVGAPGVARRQAALARLEAGMRAQPGVAAVVGAGDVRLPRGARVLRSPDGDAARALVVFRHEPFGARAADDLQRLQGAMPGLLRRAGLSGARVRYAGDTALARDTRSRMVRDMGWVALAAITVNLLVIGAFLRAVFGSLVLVGVSILTIGAALGLTTYLFQGLLGQPQLTYYVPLAVGVLLLAFGSDYNIVVVGRIWQETDVRPVREAVEAAAPAASRAIGIAGVALAASFASLAIVPLAPFREVAAAVALGVLLDTFLVRGLLIPAVISAMGRWSRWPVRGAPPAGAGGR